MRIQGDLYGRFIPAADLELDRSRVIDLTTETGLEPVSRTNGTGLPGYQAGWFKLRNGQQALVFLIDRAQVVYLPTHRGYVMLLSVDQPEAFLQSLQRHRTQ